MEQQINIKHTYLNILIKSVYYGIIIILSFYVLISAYSYYSVWSSFGEVPSGNDYLYELARKRNLEIKTFPTHIGMIIFGIVGYSLFFVPVFIILNCIITSFKPAIAFPKIMATSSICVYVLTFLLLATTDAFGGWYMQYLLD